MPATPPAPASASPVAPAVIHDWLAALRYLRDDVEFGLPKRGILNRLDDLIDGMQRHRQANP